VGIGQHTPASVHFGAAEACLARRAVVLSAVCASPSSRAGLFVDGPGDD
jgi:hypothetical protein